MGTVPAIPVPKLTKLLITLKPDAPDALITVDGIDVKDKTIDLPLGDQTKKEVTVVIKAPGYKELTRKLEIVEGEIKVDYELIKARVRTSPYSSTPKRPPPPGGSGRDTPPPKRPSNAGMIDL